MAATTVRIDLKALKRFQKQIDAAARTGSGQFKPMFRQWAKRYEVFVRRRFNTLSRSGGGKWDPLDPDTIRKRRGGGNASILKDTGQLFNALSIGQPGNLEKPVPGGVRFGLSKSKHHSGLSFEELTEIHSQGKGVVPARPIIVEPDRATLAGMLKDLQRVLQRAGK